MLQCVIGFIFLSVSYLINVGAMDKLQRLITSVRAPVDSDTTLASFLQATLQLLTAMTRIVSKRYIMLL